MKATARDAAPPQPPRYDINPVEERLIALRRLARWHADRTGERVHRSAPYRWARRGIRGVLLPTVQVGGIRYTSEAAIAWWTAMLTGGALS